jgi:hypothetical protein
MAVGEVAVGCDRMRLGEIGCNVCVPFGGQMTRYRQRLVTRFPCGPERDTLR